MTSIVIFLPRAIPMGENVFFLASLFAFLVSFIVVLAKSDTKQPAKVVFTEYTNVTGWSDGTAFMLGVGSCMYAFLATDGATHIAEELPNPGKNVPRAIWLTMVIGIATVFPWTIAFLFSTNDLTAVSEAALPILEVYSQALNSQGGATFMTVWFLFIYFGAGVTCVATTGRLTWAFARDNGLPFSEVFAKVHPTLKVPIWATIASTVFQILYGLIYIGSTTAFNSIINLTILGLNVTYMIPQAIVLFRGREKVLPKRYFDLGPYFGRFCNAFSLLWVSLYTILFCFPEFIPVTPNTMNYVSVVIAGVVVFITGFWMLVKKGTFVGPDVHFEAFEAASEAVLREEKGVTESGVTDSPAVVETKV